MPSSLRGAGVGDLGVLWVLEVKNQPKKKFRNVFGITLGGGLVMFPDGFDAFWAL